MIRALAKTRQGGVYTALIFLGVFLLVTPTFGGVSEWINSKDGQAMVVVPAGSFTMGSSLSTEADNVKPAHKVNLAAYSIGKMPVTNAMFRRFVEDTGYDAGADWLKAAEKWGDRTPVVYVPWRAAAAYCAWAGLRLPTEAEWEKAARGTDGRSYPWGNAWDPERAWCSENSSHRPHPVGTKPSGASPYGCMDMAGNVLEWTASWYNRYPGNTKSDPGYGRNYRVRRGGSWRLYSPEALTTYSRYVNALDAEAEAAGHHFYCESGFRCAKSFMPASH